MKKMTPIAVMCSVLVLGPILSGYYGSLVLWVICQQGVMALSYDFMGGMAGKVHLGHGFYFGLGAYVCIISKQAQIPWPVGVVASAICGAVVSKLVSLFLSSLRGMEFAVSSLCLALVGGILARNLEPFTGGSGGISARAEAFGVVYVFSVCIFLISFEVHRRLLTSFWGRALRASGADPIAASSLGISTKRIEGQAMVLGSTLAAIAGSIYPLQSGYVSPESAFGLDVMLSPIAAVMIGGGATTWGPLWGATILVLLQEIALGGIPGANLLVFGIFFMAAGLWGHSAPKELVWSLIRLSRHHRRPVFF